jgi:hypothetical protein
MTFVHATGGRVRRLAIAACLAAGMLAGSAAVATEEASAHGGCFLQVRAPHLSPSGGQIRGWTTFDCDFQHEVVQTCVAVERREGGQWETFGEAPHKCNHNANTKSARAQIGRPCTNGTYRTYGDGHAVGANGHRHDANRLLYPSGGVQISCPRGATAPADTSLDDVLFLTGDLLTVSGI